jgi:hypothetical protein
MRTLQSTDINAVTGGCFLGGDGEYHDLMPNGDGTYSVVPCRYPIEYFPVPPPSHPECPVVIDPPAELS